jgi:hypothetical protein
MPCDFCRHHTPTSLVRAFGGSLCEPCRGRWNRGTLERPELCEVCLEPFNSAAAFHAYRSHPACRRKLKPDAGECVICPADIPLGRRFCDRHHDANRAATRNHRDVSLVDQLRLILALSCACWSCGRSRHEVTGALLELRLDHDHSLGLVRGVLCDGCNQALGRLDECRRTISSAVAYLEDPPIRRGEIPYRRPFPPDEKRRLACAYPRCGVCGRHRTVRDLVVDHEHATGCVRGLLCQPCNLALGHLGESPARARDLDRYALRCELLVAASGRAEER